MTYREILQGLTTIKQSSILTLSPGPFPLKVNEADAMAARLLLWLEDQMPGDATQGHLDDVLDAAKWWATLLASIPISPEEQSAELSAD